MRKIAPEIDLQILENLAAGLSNKEIAEKFNVSNSYVSKVKTGRKASYLNIKDSVVLKDKFFESNSDDISEVAAYMSTKDIIRNKDEIATFIKEEINKCIIKAKIYQEILNKL